MPACTHCGDAAHHACGACGAPYCSAQCQRAAWPAHGAPVPEFEHEHEPEPVPAADAEFVGAALRGAAAEATLVLLAQLANAVDKLSECAIWAAVLDPFAYALKALADENLVDFNTVLELLRQAPSGRAVATDSSSLQKRLRVAAVAAAAKPPAAGLVALVVQLAMSARGAAFPSKVVALARELAAQSARRGRFAALAQALATKRDRCDTDVDASACVGPATCARARTAAGARAQSAK